MRIDVRDHNRNTTAPPFSPLTSQAVSADQFLHPDYLRWFQVLSVAQDGNLPFEGWSTTVLHRKVWEWAYILQAAQQHGRLRPAMTAVGFGVGNEPLPAVLASHGMKVTATDQEAEESADWDATGRWADTGQLMSGLEGLSRSQLLPDGRFGELVRARRVDMNNVPADLGPCDFVWSSCALEHLGSPEKGMEFVMASARLLAPAVSPRTPPNSNSPHARPPPTGDTWRVTGLMICAVWRVRPNTRASRCTSTFTSRWTALRTEW